MIKKNDYIRVYHVIILTKVKEKRKKKETVMFIAKLSAKEITALFIILLKFYNSTNTSGN